MSKIKVVHFCDKFGLRGSTIHGVTRLFAWWFPLFDKDKYDVKLYGIKRPDNASQALEADGVPIIYMHKSVLNPATLSSFVSVIKREKADIIHLHGWIAANFGRVAGHITGVPSIMHEHGVDPKFPWTQRMADRALSSYTIKAVAVSKSVADFLITERYVDPRTIEIIYNGAPLKEFSPSSPEIVSRTRRELGIPDGSPVIGTVGRLDIQKGITYLIKAAPTVCSRFPNVRFVIVGDGPRKEELEQEARDLGVQANFIFTGHRTDVPVIQSMMDVQAFPSLWEGTPLTAFEAISIGQAIVSTNVDGLGEILLDGENAIVVEPSRAEPLAAGITQLLSDPELRDKLRNGAKSRSKDFDICNTVRNLESIYDELYAGS